MSSANPLTTMFDVPHGQAVGVMLPHVIRFNATQVERQYLDLLRESDNGHGPLPGLGGGVEGLADFVTAQLSTAGLGTRLRPLGVDPLQLPALAAQATRQWTATFNPRQATEEELLALYQQAF